MSSVFPDFAVVLPMRGFSHQSGAEKALLLAELKGSLRGERLFSTAPTKNHAHIVFAGFSHGSPH
jgi:hypothetical protein